MNGFHVDSTSFILSLPPSLGALKHSSATMGWVYNATPEVEAASQHRLILAVCLTLTILMVLTVCLRLLLRAKASRLGAADWVMVGSMVSIFCGTRVVVHLLILY